MSADRKKLPRVSLCVIVFQLLSTIAFLGFVYAQANMISELEGNRIGYLSMLATAALMVLYIVLELLEYNCREHEYALCCRKTKAMAAQAFSHQLPEQLEKTQEQYISYFANEVGTVLEQTVYMRLFIQKQLIMVVLSFLMLVAFTRACSILVLVSAVIFGFLIHNVGKKLPQKQSKVQEAKASFLEEILELHRGVGEIHINQMEHLAEGDFERANQAVEYAIQDYKSGVLQTILLATAQNMMIYIIILIAGGLLAINGVVGIGIFISATELSVQVLNGWSVITQLQSIVTSCQPMTQQLEQFLSQQGDTLWKTQAPVGDVLIELQNVSVQYGQETPLLENVNIALKRGRKYLLCGSSGCGKSTLAEYIVGRKRSNGGKIIRYTDRIAYVPQSPFLFPGTLKENLALGINYTESDMKRILSQVGLELDLYMDVEHDGNNLSGGQKARVALARALLTKPELLVVDEVTANLDKELAQRIEKVLMDASPDMTLLQITHTVYDLTQYDDVFKVNNRCICEVRK